MRKGIRTFYKFMAGEGGRSPNFTGVEDEQELQQTIQEVRALLNEADD